MKHKDKKNRKYEIRFKARVPRLTWYRYNCDCLLGCLFANFVIVMGVGWVGEELVTDEDAQVT